MKSLLVVPVFAALVVTAALFNGSGGKAAIDARDRPGPTGASRPNSLRATDYVPLEIPANKPVPKLELRLYRDKVSGLNLHLDLRNFQIGPPELRLDNDRIGGHAHLYVNGKKIQRIYGHYVHLPKELFRPGVNLVMVSLNTGDHRVWQYRARQLLASSFVTLNGEQLVLHRFSSSPIL